MINALPIFFLIVINQSKHKAKNKRKESITPETGTIFVLSKFLSMSILHLCKILFVYIWSVWTFQMIYKRWCFPFLKIKRKLHGTGPGGPGGASEGLVPAAADQRQAEQQQQAGGQSDRGRRHHVRSVGLRKGSRNISDAAADKNSSSVEKPAGKEVKIHHLCRAASASQLWAPPPGRISQPTDKYWRNKNSCRFFLQLPSNEWQISARTSQELENCVEFLT